MDFVAFLAGVGTIMIGIIFGFSMAMSKGTTKTKEKEDNGS